MEGLVFDIHEGFNEIHNFTVYSDLHDDARECAHDVLKKHMDERAALPNAHFFTIGDVSNFIMPGPDKRHTPSTPIDALAASDEYIDEQVKRQCGMYAQYPWVALGLGNHCTSVINKHHTNPIRRLIAELNDHPDRKGMVPVQYAGYSGFARFRFHSGTGAGAKCTFNMIYHHGAWGGQIIKGKGGAFRWADRHAAGQIWNVMVYGHNHACHADMVPNVGMTDRQKVFHVDQFVVNTGTFLRGETQGGSPAYSEIRGYPPVPLHAPLIRVRPTIDGPRVAIQLGDC